MTTKCSEFEGERWERLNADGREVEKHLHIEPTKTCFPCILTLSQMNSVHIQTDNHIHTCIVHSGQVCVCMFASVYMLQIRNNFWFRSDDWKRRWLSLGSEGKLAGSRCTLYRNHKRNMRFCPCETYQMAKSFTSPNWMEEKWIQQKNEMKLWTSDRDWNGRIKWEWRRVTILNQSWMSEKRWGR